MTLTQADPLTCPNDCPNYARYRDTVPANQARPLAICLMMNLNLWDYLVPDAYGQGRLPFSVASELL